MVAVVERGEVFWLLKFFFFYNQGRNLLGFITVLFFIVIWKWPFVLQFSSSPYGILSASLGGCLRW